MTLVDPLRAVSFLHINACCYWIY